MKGLTKYFWVLVFACSFSQLSYAQMQSQQVQMLLQSLENTTDNTQKIRIFTELSREHTEVNPREARRYAESALSIAIKINDKVAETQALLHLGKAYYYMGDYPQAKGYYLGALDFCENLKLKTSESEALRGMADVFSAMSRQYYDANDTQKAEEYQKYYHIYLGRYQMLAESSAKILAMPRSKENTKENTEKIGDKINAEKEKSMENPFSNDRHHELTKNQKRELLEEIKNSATPRNVDAMTIAERNEEIKHLRFEKQKKDRQITNLVQENLHKEETLERQNMFLLGCVIALFGFGASVVVYFLGNNQQKNKLTKEQKQKIKDQANRLNKQEILVRENEDNLRKKENELLHNYTKIDTLNIEHQSLTSLLKEEFQPQIASLSAIANMPSPNIDLIKQNTLRLKNLVDTTIIVQEFSKNMPPLATTSQEIKKVAEKAGEQFTQIFEQKNLTLKNNIPENLTAKFDKESLEKMFVNLLENAIKYAPNNSNIILDGQLLANENQHLVQISQQDFGKNIPAGSQHLTFDKTADVRVAGWGLVYVKLMVEAQQGKVAVQSDENSTVFSFTLNA